MAAQQADFFCPSTQEMSEEPGIDTTMLGSQVVHVLVWILDPSGYARKGVVTLPRSVLKAGILMLVLMRERLYISHEIWFKGEDLHKTSY